MKTVVRLTVFLLCAGAVHAELLTFEFTGSVSQIQGFMNQGISVGDPVSGWFSYDTSVAGTTDPLWGITRRWYDQYASSHVEVGAKTISIADHYATVYVEEYYNLSQQRYEDHFHYYFMTFVPSLNGQVQCAFNFLDYSGSLFNYQLPASLDVEQLGLAQFSFSDETGMGYRVTCQIDDIRLVPEPATLLLVGLGTLFVRRHPARLTE